MKKRIAILGSTGSIGKYTLDIIRKDKKNFQIILLTANRNYKQLIKQANEFKVKNILIYDDKYYEYTKEKLKYKKINIFSRKNKLSEIFNRKIDYTMSAISGLDGLKPTLEVIKFSKTIGIANKESIICGWYLIKKKLKKYNTKFIPIDSEHFSIWNLTREYSNNDIEEIILTASGGPLLNSSIRFQKTITPEKAVMHPNWKMGKKISVDSANLMNKVFEIMEANRMFNFDLEKYKILIHPQSYVHAIIKFKNGLIKMLLHDVDMKIPIFNSIYDDKLKYIASKKINSKTLNNLNFYEVDKTKFPSIKLLKKISKENTLYDTVITIANDELVKLFLQNKISLRQVVTNLIKIINLKEYKKYFSKKPTSLNEIHKVRKLVRLKTNGISV
jgi:1-deoxy-D-xylulose-5-phosphate reductoisomerase